MTSRETPAPSAAVAPALDCLIIGGGPAGLTAGLYLARFGRSFAMVDAGDPRAAWIPVSHNIPFFPEGIGGSELMARQRSHLDRYGEVRLEGEVTALERTGQGWFEAQVDGHRPIMARRVILATGSDDIEPDLPDLPQAIRRGLVRYCPICDGYEARGQRIAVIGHGARGLGEAVFMARTYGADTTLLMMAERGARRLELTEEERGKAEAHRIRIVGEGVTRIETEGGRLALLETADGRTHRFDSIYSALGLIPRSSLAASLGAERGDCGSILVDDHCRSSVEGLYAIGGVVKGLDQVVIAMGHAAVAATDVHNGL